MTGDVGRPDAPKVPVIRFGVLGRVSAAVDGVEVDLGGPKQRAVVALLLLARGAVVPADRLIDSLWGDDPPPSAVGALQAHISHLRRRLEPGRQARSESAVLRRHGPGYALRVDPDAVDAWRFEQLMQRAAAAEPAEAVPLFRQALDLWTGPAYADHAGEPWAEAEIARLDEMHTLCREQLLAARLASGESATVVPELETLVSEQPLREERWRLLVLALYRSHRQADALAALRRARATLADELGVDPGPALRALEAEVLAQAPTLDAPRAAPPRLVPAPPAAAPSAPSAPSAPADLVDRSRELALLQACLDDALAGQARLALIEGAAGIGKSRLLAETRRLGAAAGAVTLTGRSSQLEREFGFGLVRQLFEPVLADPARRQRLLAGAAHSAAAVFDDGGFDLSDGHPSAAGGRRGDGLFGVLHGLYWLTANLAEEQPLLLAIDDLQWCDIGSLQFLTFLTRRLEGMPVLLVGTVRTGEPADPEGLLAELSHGLAAVPIRPQPLSLEGVGDLVRSRLGEHADDAFVAACHRTTGGNPLLLRQLLHGLETDRVRPDASHADTVTAIGSRAISSMVLMRLGRLPQAATATARAIAVLGDGAELPAVAQLAGLAEGEAAAAVAGLVRAEVLRDEYPLGFVHALVRDAVYRELPAGERELQHEGAARVLDGVGAAPEQVAAHLLQAPRRGDAWTVEVLTRAAARSAERGAADSAATYLRRALEEPPAQSQRGGLLLQLGWLESMANGPRAVEHLTDAYQALVDDPVERGRAGVMLARTLVFAGDRGEAARFAREASAALPASSVDERQGLLALERISAYMHGLDVQTWPPDEYPKIVGTGPGARMLAAQQAWDLFIRADDRDRCIALARFALEGDELRRVDTGLLWVVAAIVLDLADESVGDFWEETLADAHARGSMFSALSTHLWLGYRQWRAGDLPEALQSVSASNEQSERWGNPRIGVPYGEAFITGVLLDRGDVAAARAYLDGRPVLPRIGDGARLFEQARAQVLLAEGRYDEALSQLDAIRPLQSSVLNPAWRPWRSLRAQALAGLGEVDQAVALVEEELAVAQAWGAPSQVGRTLRLLGELRGEAGEADLRAAVELLAGTGARLEHAKALGSLGALPGVPGDESVRLLCQALELADLCGATGFRRDIAAALAAAGVQVPAEPSGALTLTSTERRMVDLVARGADVKTIAQGLFLTPRTVEVTLAAVRDRLGDEGALGRLLVSG
jgi:DNA-binding SARP family transcriptional activator/DNA-binding CsgD family transcriptional regulator/tetratricopeptide (TPR) repeat protein